MSASVLVMVSDFSGAAFRRSAGKVLQPILTVLQVSNLSGSVEISGRCDSQFLPHLPPVRPTADNMASPFLDCASYLRDDSAMQIRQDPSGSIRLNRLVCPRHFKH